LHWHHADSIERMSPNYATIPIWFAQDMALVQVIAPRFFAFQHPLFCAEATAEAWKVWQAFQVIHVARKEFDLALHDPALLIRTAGPQNTVFRGYTKETHGGQFKCKVPMPALLDDEISHPVLKALKKIHQVHSRRPGRNI